MASAGQSLRKVASSVNPPVSFGIIQSYKQRFTAELFRKSNAPATVSRPQTCVSHDWCEAELIDIVWRAKHPVGKAREDLNLARMTVMDIAKLNGYIAPTQTTSLSLNIHAMSPTQLGAALKAALAQLPADRQKQLVAAEPELAEFTEVTPEVVTASECIPLTIPPSE